MLQWCKFIKAFLFIHKEIVKDQKLVMAYRCCQFFSVSNLSSVILFHYNMAICQVIRSVRVQDVVHL